MDINSILNTDGYHKKNPYYKEGNGQPEYIITDNQKPLRTTADIFMEASQRGDLGVLGTYDDYRKYIKQGITPSKLDDFISLDKQLAENQSAGSKLWNALKQTVWNELTVGTVKTFADMFDIITGDVFRSDGDYQNPLSAMLEKYQEEFRENNPINVAPNVHLGSGALSDWGWWMNNLPSIASSLTLLIPSKAATKLTTLAPKGIKYLTRSSSKVSKGIKTEEEMMRMNKLKKKLREDNFITSAERIYENGMNALVMRTLENYQEGRQVYNDMYAQASKSLNDMSVEEYQNFIEANRAELQNDDINLFDRDAVAKRIASNAADKTFLYDYRNIIFDVIQVNALRNPLKYGKNIRTTGAVNRSQREVIEATKKAAGVATEKEAKRSILTGVKNFVSDKSKALGIVGAELTEGVEEVVNYIAQQEGMTYGNLMLDPENTEHSKERRFKSYFTSGDLWDAAFWGVMGGVAFEAGGSGINRIKNATKGKIRDRKATNDKTKESLDSKKINSDKVNWRERFETSENKSRTSKINKRLEHFNTLNSKLKSINDNKNPYENNVTIDPIEKEALTEKAINEYVMNLAFDAIDSGTWDLTKDYLRDKGVQESLRKIGVITNSSDDVETLIKKMDNVERIYNDNLIMLNGISARFDNHTPFEYYQIIARENTEAQLNINNINDLIKTYEIKAEEHKGIFSSNLDNNIDYKTAVELQSFGYRLGILYDKKRSILKDQSYAKSIEGQLELNDINKEINLIGQHLTNLENVNSSNFNSNASIHTKLLWALGYASRFELDSTTNRYKLSNTDEYTDFLTALGSRDSKRILDFIKTSLNLDINSNFEHSDYFYKLSDEDIVSLFGENETSTGSYHNFLQDMNRAFNTEKDNQGNIVKELSTGIQHKAPDLNDDYVAIAGLNLRKIKYNAQLANTTQSVNARINEMHNYMNQARSKAITLANKTIFDYAKKYGAKQISDYIFTNENELDNITEKEKKELDDAILVLNLTSKNNYELGRVLQQNLREAELRGILEDIAEEAQHKTNLIDTKDETDKTGKNSSGPKNPPQSKEVKESIVTSQNKKKSDSGQITDNTGEINDKKSPKQDKKVKITFDLNGALLIDTINRDDNDFGYDYDSIDNDRIVVKAKETQEHTEIPKEELAKSELYDGYDANNTNKPIVTSNPLIVRTNDGNYVVSIKGSIEYKSKEKSSNSSTGVVQHANIDENGVPLDDAKRIEKIQNNTAAATQEIKAKIEEKGKENVTEDDLNEWYDDIKTTLSLTSGLQENDLNESIATSKKLITRVLKAKGFLKSAANVMSSTIIEYANDRLQYTKDYKEAVSKMIEDYCKDYNIEKIDGKYYVKLEDILRRINHDFEQYDMSDYMYSDIIEYLNSNEFEGDFVIVDKDLDTVQIESKKTLEDKQSELIALGNSQRVDIDSLFKDPSKEFIDTFKTLRTGDKLGFIFKDNNFYITKNGNIVGRLPLPDISSRSGAFNKTNMGWNTEVWIDSTNNKVTSNLQPIFRDILLHKDPLTNTIYQTILALNYNLVHPGVKNAVTEQLYKDLNTFINKKYTTNNNPIEPKADHSEVVEHICNLFNYFSVNSVDPEGQEAYINQTLDNWFKKLHEGYKQIYDLKLAYDNKVPVSFEITKITSGELIKNVTTAATENKSNYDEFTQSNSALSDPNNATLMIVDPEDRNNTISSKPVSLTVNQITKRNGSGTIYVAVLKNNRDAKDSYTNEDVDCVIGTSARVNDDSLKGPAKKIYNAVKDELNRRIDKYFSNPTTEGYKELEDFCQKLFYTTTKQDPNLVYGVKPNVGLFYGVNYVQQKKANNGFQLQLINGFIINIVPPRIVTNENTLEEETVLFNYTKTGTTGHISYNSTENSKTVLKELFNKIFDKVGFNVSKEHIISDTTGNNNPGLISRNEDSKEVSITIPNSSNGKDTTFKFKSFSELVIKGGFIRINTHKEKGSNYRHKGENQQANQILEGKILIQSTTPVEKEDNLKVNQSTDIKSKFKDNKLSSIDVLNEVFPDLDDELLKSINNLELLPKSIIFVSDLNNTKDEDGKWIGPNAQMIIGKDDTYVGNKWIDLFNETGEFSNGKGFYKQQAIRKLIHENIHHKLHKNNGELEYYIPRIKEIYNEFEQWLDNNNIDSDDKLRQYLFKNKSDENERFEEFIVEALTSGELIDKLNSIESKSNEHYKDVKEENKTLWQKLIDLISKLFNWDVKENTLREKTLMIFKDNYEKLEKTDEEVKEQPKVKPKFGGLQTRGKINRNSSIIENTNAYTNEMQQIKDQAIANGTFMKAPNGNPTNLNEKQWLQVRTKAFKDWFGDWENDHESASKVVDENGEPLVVYHCSKKTFTKFEKQDKTVGFFFSSDKNYAKRYGNITYEVFLNIRKPANMTIDFYKDKDGNKQFSIPAENVFNRSGKQFTTENNKDVWFSLNTRYGVSSINIYKLFNSDKAWLYDGVIGNDVIDVDSDGNIIMPISSGKEYVTPVATFSNPIKSATGNIGTFSRENNDIRYSEIVEEQKLYTSPSDITKQLDIENKSKYIDLLNNAEINIICK